MHLLFGKTYSQEPTYKEFHLITKALILASINSKTAMSIIYDENGYADIFANVVKDYYKFDPSKKSNMYSWLRSQMNYHIQNYKKKKVFIKNKECESIDVDVKKNRYKSYDKFVNVKNISDEYSLIRERLKENKEALCQIINSSGLSDKQISDVKKYSEGYTVSQIARDNNENKQTVDKRIKHAIDKMRKNAKRIFEK